MKTIDYFLIPGIARDVNHYFRSHILMPLISTRGPLGSLESKTLIPKHLYFGFPTSTVQYLLCVLLSKWLPDRSSQRIAHADLSSQSSSFEPMNCHFVAPRQKNFPSISSEFAPKETRPGTIGARNRYQIIWGKWIILIKSDVFGKII